MDDTAIVTFSYASPFHDSLKLEERLFDVGIPGRTITIKQHWAADGKGGSDIGFGASVYSCSFVLAWHLVNRRYGWPRRSLAAHAPEPCETL